MDSLFLEEVIWNYFEKWTSIQMENIVFIKQTEWDQGLGWEASWVLKHKLCQWLKLTTTYKFPNEYTHIKEVEMKSPYNEVTKPHDTKWNLQ